MTKPAINVTPLIDVLLVLLIIFMVVSPLKPSKFETRIPAEPKTDGAKANPYTLVVALDADLKIKLNGENDFGTVDDSEKLVQTLRETFRKRAENGIYAQNSDLDDTLAAAAKIEKTVFIKAPKNVSYGSVAKVVDAVKLSGASPISLQIDDLN